MGKNLVKRSCSIVIMIFLVNLVFTFGISKNVFANGLGERLSGSDRYGTAAQIAKTSFPQGVDVAILARGDNLADGLVASYLSGALNAPILLTRPNSLPVVTENTLMELGVKKVYAIGGSQAISNNVITRIEGQNIGTERIAGKNRFETAVVISEKAGVKSDTALLVNGTSFADALAVGPVANAQGLPIFLVRNNNIPVETQEALKKFGIEKVILIGGKSVISTQIENDLKNLGITDIERVAGIDRFATSVEVAKRFFAESRGFLIANGLNNSMVDAVGAAVLGKPILFVNGRDISPKVNQFIVGRENFLIIGGENSIPQGLKGRIIANLKPDYIPKITRGESTILRIEGNPEKNFYWHYYLYIPANFNPQGENFILVEPNNTGTVSDDIDFHDKYAKLLVENSFSVPRRIADSLQTPLLVPVFPRPASDVLMYTHALDRQTLLKNDGNLRRIDLQLKEMIRDAQKILRGNGFNVEDKVFMNGFSASGNFLTRFPILHPEIVQAVAAGGLNGIPTFPVSQWRGIELRYPVGISDIEEITGQKINIEEYKRVAQFFYMGYLDKNDTTLFRDAYDEEDANLIRSIIGEDIMDRWEESQRVFRENGFKNTQFHTYYGQAHWITNEMVEDIIRFFNANKGDEIVHIEPYQYPYVPFKEHEIMTIIGAQWAGQGMLAQALNLRENQFIVLVDEWFEDQDFQQMNMFFRNLPNEGRKITLKAPGKPDVIAVMTGGNFSNFLAERFRGFVLEIPESELSKMESGIQYTLHPGFSSNKYRFIVNDGVTIVRPQE